MALYLHEYILTCCVFYRFKEIAGSLENAIADGLVTAPGQ